MLRGKERAKRLDEEIAAIREQVQSQELSGLDLDVFVDDVVRAAKEEPVPVTLQQLEKALVESISLGRLFKPHPDIPGAHILTWNGQRTVVTFDPMVFDKHPNTVQLLTYGNPLLGELLASIPDPDGSDGPKGGIGILSTSGHPPVSVCVRGNESSATPVRTISELQGLLAEGQPASAFALPSSPSRIIDNARQSIYERIRRVEEARKRSEHLSWREEARQVLIRTRLVYNAESQRPELFNDVLPFSFGEEAVLALADKDKLYRALLKIAGDSNLACEATDPYFLSIQGLSSESLKRKREGLARQGHELAHKYAAAMKSRDAKGSDAEAVIKAAWYALPSATGTAHGDVLPFRILQPEDVRPFENAIPLYDLKVAAGLFSDERYVDEVLRHGAPVNAEEHTWVELPAGVKPSPDLFVSQVVGDSMNRRIPNGAYCVFRLHPKGTRQGKVVLAQHREIHDADLGGHYTVKIYASEKVYADDGTWEHSRIILQPDSNTPDYAPIVLENAREDEFRVIAEVIRVF